LARSAATTTPRPTSAAVRGPDFPRHDPEKWVPVFRKDHAQRTGHDLKRGKPVFGTVTLKRA
jgi:hypothetical protein